MIEMSHREILIPGLNAYLDSFYPNPKDLRVLEIGAGGASFQGYFESKGFKWTGTDINGKSDPAVIEADMASMPQIESNKYDFVFACHCVEHCERVVDALREFMRVLKPGGRLFIATPSPCEKQTLYADDDHIMVLTWMQAKRLLLYTGFAQAEAFVQMGGIKMEQDHNVIWTAWKPDI